MGDPPLVLAFLMLLGVLARHPLIVAASGGLLVLHYLRLPAVIRYLDQRGLELGLILLLVAVLVPFAVGRISWQHMTAAFTSATGLAAIVGGFTATVVSGFGIDLLGRRPEVIVGLVVGSILGVILARGVPVGPLAAAGIAALILRALGQG